MTGSACPDKRALLEYTAGRGDAALRSAVEKHLAHCATCRQIVALATDHTTDVQSASEQSPEKLFVSGSHLGCDVAEPGFADQSTRRCPTPDEVASRFDFELLEPPRRQTVLGHLGKYEVLEVLGYGGMGVVFKAQDEQLLRAVAIKVMSRDLAASPTARRRFIREARAAAAINHPNVVTIHNVDEHNGTPFLVMEFIEGESLRDRLRHGPRLALLDVLRIASQLATGLAAAHAHGVIHRDIKPGNVMLQDGLQRVKITDFGLARVAVDNVELTTGQIGIGTPAYMSPEQVRGDEIDARSDLFALGCVIYAMLRGHSPFHGKSTLDVARKVADGEPSPPVAESTIPVFLTEIIERLLQKSPDKRYQSAAEVSELLRRHLALINQTPTDKLGQVLSQATSKPRPTARLHLAGTVAALALVVALLAWAGIQFKWFQPTATAPPPNGIPSVTGGTPSADSSQEPPPAELKPLVTVSQSGDSDFKTISEALRRVATGGQVTVVDAAEYVETIRLTDSQRYAGVRLIATAGATLRFKESGPVILVRAVPNFRIQGLKIVATQAQVGIEINGNCPGLQLENIKIQRIDNPDGSAVSSGGLVIWRGAAGTAEQPIVVRGLTLQSTKVGVVIGNPTTKDPLSHHIIVEESLVLGRSENSTLLALVRHSEDVAIRRNIFASGQTGLSILTQDDAKPNRCDIRHNTWHEVRAWVQWTGLVGDSVSLQVHDSLIVDAQQVGPIARSLASLTAEPRVFKNNILVNLNTSAVEPFPPLAAEMPDFPLLSLDATHPHYLKPDFVRLKAMSSAPHSIPGRYSEIQTQ